MKVDIAAIRAAAEKAGHFSVSWRVPDRDYRYDKSVPVGDFAQLDNDDVEQGQGETLARYIAMLDPQTVLALCDLAERALPTAPLAEDVQADIAWLESEWIAWGNPAVRNIIAALHAATAAQAAAEADRERLRAALERIATSEPGAGWLSDADRSHMSGVDCFRCDEHIADAMAALAATPTPDVVVVPKAEYERLLEGRRKGIEAAINANPAVVAALKQARQQDVETMMAAKEATDGG